MWLLSAGKELPPEVEMSIPGLDWGVDEVMGKETKKVPQKKVPYAKPIPAQFQQVPEHERTLRGDSRVLGCRKLTLLLCAGLGGE